MARRSGEREGKTAHFGLYDEDLQVVDLHTRPSTQYSDAEGLQVAPSHQSCPGKFAVHDRPSTQYSDAEGLQLTPQPYLGKFTDTPLINKEERSEGKEAVQMDPEDQAGKEPYVRASGRKMPVYIPTRNNRRRRLWLIAVIIAIIIVVCAVVISVVLIKSGRHNTSSASSATTVSTSDLSTSGAFNGSGLATMNPVNGKDQIWVVWQDYTGAVALSRMASGSWQSPQFLQLENVMNGTYLEAISYIASDVINVCAHRSKPDVL